MASDETQAAPTPDRFPATRWSLVAAAASPDEPTARRALGELCQIYWYPVYCYLRNKGNRQQDAEDLAQGFFANLIERESLHAASEERGKLRSYLLTALKNYVSNSRRHASAAKRGGGKPLVSIDAALAEEHFALEPPDGETPERLFEKTWARTLLDRVRAQVADSYARAGKASLAEGLAPYIGVEEEEPPYRSLAEKLSMSVGSLRVAVFRMRQKFRATLEREIIDTLADPSEVESEIGYLMRIFQTA